MVDEVEVVEAVVVTDSRRTCRWRMLGMLRLVGRSRLVALVGQLRWSIGFRDQPMASSQGSLAMGQRCLGCFVVCRVHAGLVRGIDWRVEP